MIYIREKAHEAGKSLPAVAVVFFCRRHRSSFALSLRFRRVLELAGFSIGVLDRGIFSLPKLLARTVLISITALFLIYYFFFPCFSQLIT